MGIAFETIQSHPIGVFNQLNSVITQFGWSPSDRYIVARGKLILTTNTGPSLSANTSERSRSWEESRAVVVGNVLVSCPDPRYDDEKSF